MEKFFNRREVATYLGVSESTVQRMVKKGELPSPIRIGPKLIRWSENDIVQAVMKYKDKVLDKRIDEVEQLIAAQV